MPTRMRFMEEGPPLALAGVGSGAMEFCMEKKLCGFQNVNSVAMLTAASITDRIIRKMLFVRGLSFLRGEFTVSVSSTGWSGLVGFSMI
jgi:hypothetical protein